MNKQRVIEIFEEVLKDWEMAQGALKGETVLPYGDEDITNDVEEYRRSFLEALNAQ